VAAIALTAHAGDEPRQQALAAGSRRVETKPIESQRLLAAVRAELARQPVAGHSSGVVAAIAGKRRSRRNRCRTAG